MWFLEWVPPFMVHITIIVSLLALIITSVINTIPFINTYIKPIQIFAIILLIMSVWLEGGLAEQAKYKELIAQSDLKIQKLQTESSKVTIKEVIKYQDREKKIYIKGKDIETKVVQYVDRINSTGCIIPNEVIKLTDEAADQLETK